MTGVKTVHTLDGLYEKFFIPFKIISANNKRTRNSATSIFN